MNRIYCPVERADCAEPKSCGQRCALIASYAAPRQLPRMFEPDFGIERHAAPRWHAEPRGLRVFWFLAAAAGVGFGLYRYFFST
jgi:hypothetical protein